MSLHIPESEAALAVSVQRGILASLGTPDPLMVAAECENEADVPRRLREIEIAQRTAQAMQQRQQGSEHGF